MTTPTTPVDLDAIAALAGAASPGPWTVDDSWPDDVVVYTEEDRRWVVNVGNWSRQAAPDTHPEDSDYLRNAFECDAADARYIAALSPDVALALVAAAEALGHLAFHVEEAHRDHDLGECGQDVMDDARRALDALRGVPPATKEDRS